MAASTGALLFSTRTAPLPADCALVVARTILAWVFIYHGARRLFGWFDGPGLHRSADYFAHTAGLHPGVVFAALGGTVEFFGGIALVFGLLSRLAGAAIFGDMMMAVITVMVRTIGECEGVSCNVTKAMPLV